MTTKPKNPAPPADPRAGALRKTLTTTPAAAPETPQPAPAKDPDAAATEGKE